MAKSGTAQADYAYTLGPAGNRTGVTELSGRTVQYGYDDLYRLTSETIAGSATQNGNVTYVYDPVGNRLALNSSLAAIPSGLLNYDANDRLATDAYDADGNTTVSASISNDYDFENHLIRRGAITIVYDGDGNRVQKTAGGVTTKFLVSEVNPTGYVQVLDELQAGAVVRRYSYGLDLLSETQKISGVFQTSFYSFDGHGSVRQLTNTSGTVTDSYTYDAFGNLIEQTGSTPNLYLYAGQQFDPDLGLYYNRARYLDVRDARFITADTIEPQAFDPTSLHRYLYCSMFVATCADPSGNDPDIASTLEAAGEEESIGAQQASQATRVGRAAEKIAQALKRARDIGKAGEEAIEDFLDLEKNTERIQSITRAVKFRVPDYLEQDFLIEVKNVAYQYLSRQVLDLAYYASVNGLTFYLAIRSGTQLSEGLQELVDSGVIKLLEIP